MKELDAGGDAGDAAPQKKNSSDDDAVLVDAGGPAGAQGPKKKKGKK